MIDMVMASISHYHQLCQNDTSLLCFYSHNYFCFCDLTHYQAICLTYNRFSDRCSNCLSNGVCLNGQNEQGNFKCLCPKCFYGDRCQYSTALLSYSLDALTVKSQIGTQVTYVLVVFLLLFLVSLFTNYCTFSTFKRSSLLDCAVRYYLLIISFASPCSIFFLLLKLAFISLGTITTMQENAAFSFLCCRMVSFFLSAMTKINNWLTSLITIEGLIIVCAPSMTRRTLRYTRWRLFLSLVIIITVLAMHLHELIYYTAIKESTAKLLCTIDYSNKALLVYSRFNVLFHYFVPFGIQVIAVTLLIVLLARQRARLRANQPLNEMIRNQFSKQKQLYLIPTIIIFSSIPQVILSFTYQCEELQHSWQRHLFLTAYLFSNVPQALGFILYVLPSSTYRQEFSMTVIGKWFFHH